MAPPSNAKFQALLGPNAFDAVRYVRNMTEDIVDPVVVSDDAYSSYVDFVARDFSRFAWLSDIVGNPNLLTSPLQTVANQQRYSCTVANGFGDGAGGTSGNLRQVTSFSEVNYRPNDLLTGAVEISLYQLLPGGDYVNTFGPRKVNEPTTRILQNEYRNELSHFLPTAYEVTRDPQGVLALLLYPIPLTAVSIYIKYNFQHPKVTDAKGNFAYATIPDEYVQWFSQLLYAMVLEQEGERLSKRMRLHSGIITNVSDPKGLYARVERLREDAYNALGAQLPRVLVAS